MSTDIKLHVVGLLLLWSPAASANLHFGDTVDRAVALHITNGGLARLGDLVEAMVPGSVAVSGYAGETLCSEDDANPLIFELNDLELLISADDVQVLASDGRLDLTLYGTLSSTASTLLVQGDCSILTELDELCSLQLPTTALSAHLGLVLGQNALGFQAVVDDLSIDISPMGNPVSDCTLASGVGTLLGQNESAISDLLLSYIEPELDGLGETLEQSIEDTLSSLDLQTDLSLLGAEMSLSIFPGEISLGDNGLLLGLGAGLDGSAADCVDSGAGVLVSGADWPLLGETVPDTSLEYDAALLLGRDFVDFLLWSVWASGALCLDATDLLGESVDTSLLSLFLGEELEQLFPQESPANLWIQPAGAPVAIFQHDFPPIGVSLEDLGVSLEVQLDERWLRLFQVDIDARVGADLDLGAEQVEILLDLDTSDMLFSETHNEFMSDGFSDGLRDLLDSFLEPYLSGGVLDPYTLPDLYGLQVGSTFWMPDADDEWQGLYLLLDTSAVEPLDVSGCDAAALGCGDETDTGLGFSFEDVLGCTDDSSSCSDLGCDSGTTCSVVGQPRRGLLMLNRIALLGLVLGISASRRRHWSRPATGVPRSR